MFNKMNIRQDDIDNLLSNWAETKEQISQLEYDLEKYKKLATKIMHKNGIDTISNNTFTLSRRELSKQTLAKNDVPKDIWNSYSRTTKYNAFYLSKKKNNNNK
jgi:diketogulonate reductase-like aldo/keto reductase